MPLMHGFDVAYRIRTMQKEGQLSLDEKLVLLSGDNIKETQEVFDDILLKPIDKSELQRIVQKYLLIE